MYVEVRHMGQQVRFFLSLASLLTLSLGGCKQGSTSGSDSSAGGDTATVPADEPSAQPGGDADVEPPEAAPEPEPEPEPIDPEHLVIAYRDGVASEMDDREVAAAGMTIVDLRDTWAPRVLRGTEELPSSYEKTYVDLANERGDPVEDADPRTANYYLEVYGISPSLTTIKNRLEREQATKCFREIDNEILASYKGFRAYAARPRDKLRTRAREFQTLERRIKRALASQGVESIDELTGEDQLVRRWRRQEKRRMPLRAAQQRLACEKLFPGRGGHIRDAFDWATHIALLNFERRHRFYGWGYFNEETAHALSWTPEESAFHTLHRALTERVIDAAGIVEDGSTAHGNGKARTYTGADGAEHEIRNLAEEFSLSLIQHLGVGTTEAAVAFLQEQDFTTLRVAVQLPDVPEYYSDNMDLYTVINRGDIWYEYPYDDEGNEISRPLGQRPTLTLYVKHGGQKIPLIKYGTTIGGWRSTVRDGVEHWAYKNSDIGPRVWKNIVGAPSWIPPNSTPVRDLVVKHHRRGKIRYEANHGELGPGYASAYGLVMGINHNQVDRDSGTVFLDNGIRVHGSVSYQSIQKRHSHGCHRLHNHLALRLFDFVLSHRPHKRLGQEPATYNRSFTYDDRSFRLKVSTRGYFWEMEPPVPVMVTRGRILGAQQTPITTYIIKPSERERLEREAAEAAQADAGVVSDEGTGSEPTGSTDAEPAPPPPGE